MGVLYVQFFLGGEEGILFGILWLLWNEGVSSRIKKKKLLVLSLSYSSSLHF